MTSQKYAKYAPAGATIKNWAWNHSFRTRLLRILHGLNLAKLNYQQWNVFEYKK
jgi:hypothetical protein